MNLENLDTIIGFALVMLLLSLVITSVVQLLGWLLRLRAKALYWGVQQILKQLAPNLEEKEVASLAEKVVKHDSIKPTRWGSATAIHFGELVTILKQVINTAKSAAAAKDSAGTANYDGLLAALNAAPTAELVTLATAIEAELSQVLPQEVARVKEATARAKATVLDAGSKVRFWFDTVMDRTTERFVTHTRVVAVLAALAFAFGARIDALDILKQLSEKHDVRAKLVEMSTPVMKQADAILEPKATDANSKPVAAADLVGLKDQIKTLQTDLAETSLEVIHGGPFTRTEYADRWLGMLISAFFLSLGAPFWFNTLRQLSNLRPILASKVEAKDAATAGMSAGDG